MVRIYNIKTKHSIEIHDSCFVQGTVDGVDFVSFQFPNSFNWHHHTYTCPDCKALHSAFRTSTKLWVVEHDGQKRLLNLSSFGDRSVYTENLSRFTISSDPNDFSGSEWKFHVETLDLARLEKELQDEVQAERYEIACDLRDVIQEIKMT